MKNRAIFLIRHYGLTMLLFIIAKVAFMLCNSDEADFTAADVAEVLWHGLTLDLSTALYVLILPFLIAIISIWVPVPRWLMRPYYALIAAAFALAFVADTSLYPFWHFKLDGSCLQYLETPTDAMASVSTLYLLLRLLALLIIAALIYTAYCRLVPATLLQKGRWWEGLVFLALIPAIIIGIRGGLSESTTNVGQVYYSQNQFLNHAAVNPVFSFLASFEKTASYIPDYQFMDEDECAHTLKGLYPTESTDIDTLLTTSRPDIVIILMESCGGLFNELGGRADVMPRLSRMMHEAVSFDSCYANSWRTDRGTLCTLSGYPSFPTSSLMKMPAKARFLPGLGKTLAKQGYQTSYIYGGDINFTNMRSYLISSGFARLTWKDDYSKAEQETSEWGVRDDITFQTLREQILQYSNEGKPYLIGFSTLSSHQPWEVPLHQFDDEILNSFYYLDTCIGRLEDELKNTPAWRNLLIILLPDHSIDYADITEQYRYRNQIPMVWTGGAIKKARRIATICNQTDLPATLLGQMGLPHTEYPYSRDVMSSNYTVPFAVHTYNNGISMADSTGFAMYDLDADRLLVNESTDADRLIHIGKAMLQSATRDVKNMK